jgi:hypothetical protein
VAHFASGLVLERLVDDPASVRSGGRLAGAHSLLRGLLRRLLRHWRLLRRRRLGAGMCDPVQRALELEDLALELVERACESLVDHWRQA